MHCDYLHVTVPIDHADTVERDLLDLFGYLGSQACTEDLHRLGGGTLKISRHPGFVMFGMSGQVLEHLRLNGEFTRCLFIFAESPHRVTKIDVAHDIPQHSPPVLQRLLRKARTGGLALTRKRLRPQSIRFIDNHNHYEPGVRTGTIYLGGRTAKVYARVYDKRNERLDRDYPDPGNLTRYELTVTGKLCPTLRDVVEPAAMFWHFMSEVLPAPSNAPEWSGKADGFKIDTPLPFLPAEILRRRVETSADVEAILELADRIGPHGFNLLVNMLKRKAKATPDQHSSGSQTGT